MKRTQLLPDEKQRCTNVADEKLLPPRPEVDLATFQAAYGARDRARKRPAAQASPPLEEDAGQPKKKSPALAKGSAAKAQVSLRRNRVPWLRVQLQRHPLLLRKTQVSLRRNCAPWLRVQLQRTSPALAKGSSKATQAAEEEHVGAGSDPEAAFPEEHHALIRSMPVDAKPAHHAGHGRHSYTVAYHGGRVEVMLRKKAFRPKADCQGHALQASQCLGCSMFGFSFADVICPNRTMPLI